MRTTRTRAPLGLVLCALALSAGCVSSGREATDGGPDMALRTGGGGVCAISNSLTGDQIADQRPAHLEEMLSQIPGVTVSRVGNGFTVQIRGTNGFTSNTEPLYLIDGMAVSGVRSGVLPVNPSDVECVEVLKDVGLTGAFGTRGANGVILITTRRAR